MPFYMTYEITITLSNDGYGLKLPAQFQSAINAGARLS